MKNDILKIPNKFVLLSIVVVGLLLTITGLLYSSFALVEPIKTISFTSEKLNYNEKEPGSWKVEKSAEWTSKGKARITFQVDSTLKTENKDIIFVLDISDSMSGKKLERVKQDSIELINFLLSNSNNSAALITFDTSSEILSEFTNDKNTLVNLISNLNSGGNTNYYQALINVNNILKGYTLSSNKDCIVLFLTDGYPYKDTPNEESYFSYLKQEYPYVIVNGIQYEMGEDILNPIKKVSDNQYLADMNTLNNVLFDASVAPIPYNNFILTDTIDTDNFTLENVSDINVSQGRVEFNKENQEVTWIIDSLGAGRKAKMEIDVIQKEESKSKELLSTNKKETISSKIDEIEENITSTKTPILRDNYKVIYEGNVPDGCKLFDIPTTKSYNVFELVGIENVKPTCEGYQFKEWRIVDSTVKRINSDYFEMPESDVIIRAEWVNLSLVKSMNGEVQKYIPPVLNEIRTVNYSEKLWKYKKSITKVVFQDEIRSISEAVETYDISEARNGGVMGYLVPNTEDTSTYTAYIQGDGGVIANQNSSNLFYNFTKLTKIEGLEYFDTSNATSMRYMFSSCGPIVDLDFSHFNTSKVTDMHHMFEYSKITNIDLSSFDTSNVIYMDGMFLSCYSLSNLNVSNFDTSKVRNMGDMFNNCDLQELDVSGFNTSSVTDMQSMFNGLDNLTILDVSNFDTSNVTNMYSMFSFCRNLTNLDLSNFDISRVTNMRSMFYYCCKLTNLSLNYLGASNVANMENMFYNCNSLIANVNIYNPNISSYNTMFYSASTNSGAQIIVNYIESTSDLVDQMIATKSSNSNVKKGNVIPEYDITIVGNDDITATFMESVPVDKVINLFSISGNYVVTSFRMNGLLMSGNQFTMPNSNATITDVVVREATVIESRHNPYLNSISNKIYGEKTFEGATSLSIVLDYQTENVSYDYIYLYDSGGKALRKCGGNIRTIETITIPGNYIKIVFNTNFSGNDYYGFKASIVPNYD